MRLGTMRRLALFCALAALALPATALGGGGRAHVTPDLRARAAASPSSSFRVIVQGARGTPTVLVVTSVIESAGLAGKQKIKRLFRSINGLAVTVDGRTLLKLARHPRVRAITEDATVVPSSYEDATMWPESAAITSLWQPIALPEPPAIAIVDSGIDATKVDDFGSRVVARVNLSSSTPSAVGDDQGHGTMVAGLAAGSSSAYPGVAPGANLVDVRTSDSQGMSYTSDVVAACDWILANRTQYGIRVVNMSLTGDVRTSFRFDPIDKCVERLWLNGLVVVAAGGNHGTADDAVDMGFAPGNDPFIITVGALDQQQTSVVEDDTRAPWSAYGYTADGFVKPDISAPGRYLIAPVPGGGTIPAALPDRVVAPGYMWMSGTSFSSAIVSGAAAQILMRHPEFTPDQVKGSLMLTARFVPQAGWSVGVGALHAADAAAVVDPPNPNENLNAFVVTDATLGPAFDDDAWAAHVEGQSTWSSANWSSANWSSANWASANWSSANWSSASWASANWGSANWSSANWSSANWGSANWSSANWGAANWGSANWAQALSVE